MLARTMSEQLRRRETRIFDTDWLVLRRLSAAVESYAGRLAQTCRDAIDLGCGSQPYRMSFENRGVSYRGADLGDGAEIVITPEGRVLAEKITPLLQRHGNLRALADAIELARMNADAGDEDIGFDLVDAAVTELCPVEKR